MSKRKNNLTVQKLLRSSQLRQNLQLDTDQAMAEFFTSNFERLQQILRESLQIGLSSVAGENQEEAAETSSSSSSSTTTSTSSSSSSTTAKQEFTMQAEVKFRSKKGKKKELKDFKRIKSLKFTWGPQSNKARNQESNTASNQVDSKTSSSSSASRSSSSSKKSIEERKENKKELVESSSENSSSDDSSEDSEDDHVGSNDVLTETSQSGMDDLYLCISRNLEETQRAQSLKEKRERNMTREINKEDVSKSKEKVNKEITKERNIAHSKFQDKADNKQENV